MSTARAPEDQLAFEQFARVYQHSASEKIAAASIPLWLVLGIGIVQALRFGFSASDFWLLIMSSVASLAAMVAHAQHRFDELTQRDTSLSARTLTLVLENGLWPLVPHLLGLYLVLVRGAWAFFQAIQSKEIDGWADVTPES